MSNKNPAFLRAELSVYFAKAETLWTQHAYLPCLAKVLRATITKRLPSIAIVKES